MWPRGTGVLNLRGGKRDGEVGAVCKVERNRSQWTGIDGQYLMLTEGDEELVSPPDLGEDVDESGLETDSPEKIFVADAQAIGRSWSTRCSTEMDCQDSRIVQTAPEMRRQVVHIPDKVSD